MIDLAILAGSISLTSGTATLPIAPPYTVGPAGATIPQTGMDVFNPTFAGIVPTSGAPAIAAMTKCAAPGETVNVSGYQFTGGTSIRIWGQTTSINQSPLADSVNVRSPSNYMTVVVPSSCPVRSMLIVYPYNVANGYGSPQVLNKTEATWLACDANGTPSAAPGNTCHVYGQFLSNGAGLVWVWLQPTVGAGQWVTAVVVDDYEITFIIPSIAVGDYAVWVHNGHGGAYGWSTIQPTLTITTLAALQLNFSNHSVNMSTWIAPDTGTSANAAFASALAAINALGVGAGQIVLQAGTYHLDATLQLVGGSSAARLIQGAGQGLTTIKLLAGFTAAANTPVFNFAHRGGLRDLTFDNSDGVGTPASSGNSNGVGQAQVMERVTINMPLGVVGNVSLGSAFGAVMRDCTVIGRGVYSIGNLGTIIDNCDFFECQITDQALAMFGAGHYSVTNCTFQDLDVTGNSTNGNAYKRGHGRALVGNLAFGASSHINLSYNQTIKLASAFPSEIPSIDENQGEQFLWEGNAGTKNFTAISSTVNTVTVDGPTLFGSTATTTNLASSNGTSSTPTVSSSTRNFTSADLGKAAYVQSGTGFVECIRVITSIVGVTAVLDGAVGSVASCSGGAWTLCSPSLYATGRQIFLVGGKGVGQWGATTALTPVGLGKNITFTLDRNWWVNPDTTTSVNLVLGIYRINQHHNIQQGNNNFDANSPSSAVSTYGATADFVFDSNTCSDLRFGYTETGFSNTTQTGCMQPSFFNRYSNNTFDHCLYGARLIDPGQTLQGTAAAGSTSTTLKLGPANASASTNWYNGWTVNLLSGTGGGQTATVLSYNASTKTLTINGSWGVTPDATTIYEIVYNNQVAGAFGSIHRKNVFTNLILAGITRQNGGGGASGTTQELTTFDQNTWTFGVGPWVDDSGNIVYLTHAGSGSPTLYSQPTGIDSAYGSNLGVLTLYGNVWNIGLGAFSGSKGLRFTQSAGATTLSTIPAYPNDQFIGFQS